MRAALKESHGLLCPQCLGEGRIPDPVVVGRKWRALRRAADLTQGQIASQLGFSVAYISMLENGRKAWPPRMERRYQAALRALT